jgi:hypothetical protein
MRYRVTPAGAGATDAASVCECFVTMISNSTSANALRKVLAPLVISSISFSGGRG